jgi:hypothetical protein
MKTAGIIIPSAFFRLPSSFVFAVIEAGGG